MRKTTYGLYAALALTLLVGAGCVASQKTEVTTEAEAGKMRAEGSVDASVDSIIADIDAEMGADADADAVGADSAELNAYTDTSYDLE